MPGHRPAARALVVAGLLAVALLPGCSTQDQPQAPGPLSTDSRQTAQSGSPLAADSTGAATTSDTGGPTGQPSPDRTGAVASAADGAFVLTVPQGWSEVTDALPGDVELALQDDAPSGEFVTNLVVAGGEPVEELAAAVAEAAPEMAGEQGTVRMLEEIRIGGEPAYGYVLTRTTSGVTVAQTQRWVQHGGRLYVLTYSAAGGDQEAAEQVLAGILDSWAWRD